MQALDIIAKKRDGEELTPAEIGFVVRAYTMGELPDYQMSALLMAIFFRGMTANETLALTGEMLHSGVLVDLSDLGRPCVDKHSTGGVGDKTSLVVAPVVAAAGVPVPMISGRALAHTGGTLDKLASIPGFRTDLSLSEFRATLSRVGAALVGQTEEIAPADKRLYALRDVTGTVRSLPLMAASIMSKKMAEGIGGLVLDVKSGSGAFLRHDGEARELGRTMIDIARGMGKQCVALITDMNQPLGRMVGNSLEVIEALELLKGKGPADLALLCRELAGHMLVLGGAAPGIQSGRVLYDEMIRSGRALEKLREIVGAQGGDVRVIDDYRALPRARLCRDVRAPSAGFIRAIDTQAIGRASMALGAGRLRLDDQIDPGVGLRVEAKLGEQVDSSSPLAVLYYNSEEKADEAERLLARAYTIGAEPADSVPLIRELLE